MQETLAAQAFLDFKRERARECDLSKRTNASDENRVSRILSRKIWQRKNFRGKLQKRADRPASAPRNAESRATDSHVSRNYDDHDEASKAPARRCECRLTMTTRVRVRDRAWSSEDR